MTPIDKSLVTVLVVALVIAAIAAPLALRKVPPNAIYGYRARATMSDNALWFDANAHFGRSMIAAALASAAAAVVLFKLFPPDPQSATLSTVLILVVPNLVATLATSRYVRGRR